MVLVVKGKVVSGAKIGSRFMGMGWVKRQIHEKLGFEAYPGTLNLKMDDEASGEFQSFAKSRKGVPIEPVDVTFYAGKAFKIRIDDEVDGALILPLVPNYPPDKREVIAPVNLRETLELEDGDEVTIEISES